MKSALKNLLGVTLLVVFCVSGAWVYLRGRALSETPNRAFDHPLLARLSEPGTKPIAYQGFSLSYPPNTMLAFEKAVELGPQIILWADVRPSIDGTLFVYAGRDLLQSTDKSGWVQYSHDTDIESADAGHAFTLDNGVTFPFRGTGLRIPTLRKLLETFPDHAFVLNFHDYKEGMDRSIKTLIEELDAGNRILITSAEDGILKDMREQKPEWIFGTSQAQGTRLLMFSSVGLEATIPLHGDVFVAVTSEGPRHIQISDTILSEVARRNMKTIAGPYDDYARVQADPVARRCDAVLLRDPSSFFDQVAH